MNLWFFPSCFTYRVSQCLHWMFPAVESEAHVTYIKFELQWSPIGNITQVEINKILKSSLRLCYKVLNVLNEDIQYLNVYSDFGETYQVSKYVFRLWCRFIKALQVCRTLWHRRDLRSGMSTDIFGCGAEKKEGKDWRQSFPISAQHWMELCIVKTKRSHIAIFSIFFFVLTVNTMQMSLHNPEPSHSLTWRTSPII